jgi:site-specific DNA-methyltransferase (cytosine-N4-specific)
MSEIKSKILMGDCLEILATYPNNFFDLIITSPPYADSRTNTYGGVKPDDYVAWFLPRAQQMRRVLKPSGMDLEFKKGGKEVYCFHQIRYQLGK